jgi:hypothetical protein
MSLIGVSPGGIVPLYESYFSSYHGQATWTVIIRMDYCKGNPNSLDEQLFTQDLARGNTKRTL